MAPRLDSNLAHRCVIGAERSSPARDLKAQNGLWSRSPGTWTEDPCSAEEKWSFLALFLPAGTDFPSNGPLS
jgi:hypothetical protein